jgi:hypothetical protein
MGERASRPDAGRQGARPGSSAAWVIAAGSAASRRAGLELTLDETRQAAVLLEPLGEGRPVLGMVW